MNDLVASKNEAKQYVDFSDKNTGKKLFRDDGEKIVMYHRQADINHTAVALTLAAEKFGVVKIIGTKEFKQQVLDVAVNKDLAIVFADKKMEAEFIRRKQALRLPPNTELANALCANKEKAQKESRQRVGDGQQPFCIKEERRKAVKMVSK
nr:LPD7 domain-containing protein [Vibrio hepatarius]